MRASGATKGSQGLDMVQMRPDFVDQNAPKGEKALFNMLRDVKGADNWIAMHSLDIFGDIPTGQGESDMVVLIPGKGVLFIEVKSHDSVTLSGGVWRYNGEVSEKGPVKQASNAMYGVLNYLKEQKVDTRDVPFGFVAWLTGGKKQDVAPSPEWKPWMILDTSDLKRDIKATLSEVMDQTLELKGNWSKVPSERLATVPKINEIANFLRPVVAITKTPAMRITELNENLNRAIDQQKLILEAFKGKKSPVVVPGAAGTGKTHLAISEAMRAHQRGDRTLFLCFNKVLAKYLKSQMADFALVEVHHIHSYMSQLIDQSPSEDHDDQWWQVQLPDLAYEALASKSTAELFDCLVVDEAQDLCLENYLDVMDGSLTNGLSQSPVFFFGDFTHQAIYLDGEQALANLKAKMPKIFELSSLDVNCRNTKEIGESVTQLLREPDMYSGYRRTEAGVVPTLRRLDPGEKPVAKVKEQVSRLLKTFPPENIVILSSNKQQLKHLVESLRVEHTTIDLPKNGKIRWGTAQGFKGMEAAAIVLIEFEDGTSSRDTFYVASTRALSELVVIMPGSAVEKIGGAN